MTSIFWRSAWKYRTRAYRYCFWDTGTILANLQAASNADELISEVITVFNDGPIEELLEVNSDREGVICLVALGLTASPSSQPVQKDGERLHASLEGLPVLTSMELESIPLSAKEVVYEDLLSLHRASRLSASDVDELARVRLEAPQLESSSDAITLETLGDDAALGLGETILRRGSTRVFERKPIAAEELAAIMATSNLETMKSQLFAETYLIVNAVDGVAPGAYYYNRAKGGFEPLKTGDFRGEVGYLCLEQPLGADCISLVIYMTDLERILRAFGNRGYGMAHLEAGLLGGRAYLASYSLGRGATGLTFYDDDTTAFLEPDSGQMSPLLMVAVGEPRHRSGNV